MYQILITKKISQINCSIFWTFEIGWGLSIVKADNVYETMQEILCAKIRACYSCLQYISCFYISQKTVVFNCSAESVSFIKNVFFTCYLHLYYIVNSVLTLDNKSFKVKMLSCYHCYAKSNDNIKHSTNAEQYCFNHGFIEKSDTYWKHTTCFRVSQMFW